MSSTRKNVFDQATPPARPSRIRRNTSPLLSQEEKRQLILAHAAQRKPITAAQHVGVWVAVAGAMVVIGAAWYATVWTGLRTAWAGPLDPEFVRAVAPVKAIDPQKVRGDMFGPDSLPARLQNPPNDVGAADIGAFLISPQSSSTSSR